MKCGEGHMRIQLSDGTDYDASGYAWTFDILCFFAMSPTSQHEALYRRGDEWVAQLRSPIGDLFGNFEPLPIYEDELGEFPQMDAVRNLIAELKAYTELLSLDEVDFSRLSENIFLRAEWSLIRRLATQILVMLGIPNVPFSGNWGVFVD
jgi:hypothetical protein